MPRSRHRPPGSAGRRHGPLFEFASANRWWIPPAVALAFVIAILVGLERRSGPKPEEGFPVADVEAARIKILPYRQSGLIFSWQSKGQSVLVTRSKWEALPEASRRELGQAMAVAMNVRVVRVLDERAESVLAICTAEGRCRAALDSRAASPPPD